MVAGVSSRGIDFGAHSVRARSAVAWRAGRSIALVSLEVRSAVASVCREFVVEGRACAKLPSTPLAATGALLAPVQQLGSFTNGTYLKYQLRGSVRVVVRQSCSGRGDAMLNALFFDHGEESRPPLAGTSTQVVHPG